MAKVNLFKKPAPTEAKKSKGTIIELPRELDANGQLTGESARLHQAVSDCIKYEAERKAASNKVDASKNLLNEHVLSAYCQQFATLGVQPETPVKVQNHLGESLTYVVQDRSGVSTLDEGQVELLKTILGPDNADRMIFEKSVFAFNPEVMSQPAQGEGANGETVEDIIFEIVSNAITRSNKLSDEQKEQLISAKNGIYVKPNVLPRLSEFAGANATAIKQVFKAVGSVFTKYLRT